MTQVLVTESHLNDVAEAIRAKNGSAALYKPSQMAAAIAALPDAPDLGTKSVTANGTYSASSDDLDGYSSVTVNVQPTIADKTITANGSYDPEDESLDGYGDVTVNVPNSYVASDEGKVVSNGVLVAQTPRVSSITENGTYDTTENNSVTVAVSGGGDALSGRTEPSPSLGNDGDYYLQIFTSNAVVADGASWIDTGVKFAYGYSIEAKILATEVNNTSVGVFGARDQPLNWFFLQISGKSSNPASYVSFGYSKSSSGTTQFLFGVNELLNSFRTIKYDGSTGSVLLDGTLVASFSRYNATAKINLFLFAINSSDAGVIIPSKAAIEYAKIWDANGLLVKHLVPWDDNGEVCMKDLVSGSLHKNLGTGQFSALDGTTEYVSHVWLKQSGTWSVIL